jgi:Holliday junction resolvase RusA-like endonuclease
MTPAVATVRPLLEKPFLRQVADYACATGWLVHEQSTPAPMPASSTLAPDVTTLPLGLGDSLVGLVVCNVHLDGEPVSKGRPRLGRGRTYTPTATVQAEDAIRWQLQQAHVRPDDDHTLAVRLRFHSTTGRGRDLDNLVKLVLDAANTFVWRDDVQVVELDAAVQRRSSIGNTHLLVTRVGRYTSDCLRCGNLLAVGPGKPAGREGFCNRTCSDEARRSGQTIPCAVCDRRVYLAHSDAPGVRFCSSACAATARASNSGKAFPRLVLGRGRRLLFVDATPSKGTADPLPESMSWLPTLQTVEAALAESVDAQRYEAAGRPTIEVYLWRPSDWQLIEKVLR